MQAKMTPWIAAGVVAIVAGFSGGMALAGGKDGGIGQEPTLPQPAKSSSASIKALAADPAAPPLKVRKHHRKRPTNHPDVVVPPQVTIVPTPGVTPTVRPPVVTPAPTQPPHHTVTTIFQ